MSAKAKKKTKSRAITTRGRQPSRALAVHQPQPPKSILQVISEAAANPKVDVQKMKELLTMRREEQDREAEILFNDALLQAQKAMPSIPKDKQGAHKIPYASLEAIQDRITAIYQSYNFSLSFGMADSTIPNHYRITAELAHQGGHKRHYFADFPADTSGPKGGENKSAVQAIGSTMSFGQRYLTKMIFNLRIVGEDNDGAGSSTPVSDEQLDKLIALKDRLGVNPETFCKHMKVGGFAEIPAKRFNEAYALLQGFRAGMAHAQETTKA